MSSTVNDIHNDAIDATIDDAIDTAVDHAIDDTVSHSIDDTVSHSIDDTVDTDNEESFEYMLSTIDNPYDYFDNFNEWYMYDSEKNYNSCSLLARIAKIKNDMTQKEIDDEISKAIDKIIVNDFLGIRIKIKRKRN